MVLGRTLHSRQSPFGHESFIRLIPCGNVIAHLDPVGIRCFIAPPRQLLHHSRVSSRAAKSSHGLFALPYRQSPECQARVEKEPSSEKARCAHPLTLTQKRTPQERWNEPNRSHSQARDRCQHNHLMFKRDLRRKYDGSSASARRRPYPLSCRSQDEAVANLSCPTTQPSPLRAGWQCAAAVLPTPTGPCRIRRSRETADHPRARVPGMDA